MERKTRYPHDSMFNWRAARRPRKKPPTGPVAFLKAFLKLFPQDESQWHEVKAGTPDDFVGIYDKLTLAYIPYGIRAGMSLTQILQVFGRRNSTLLGDHPRSQIHTLVFLALSIVAIDIARENFAQEEVEQIHKLTEQFVKLPGVKVTEWRLGVKKWITVADAMRGTWFRRVDELPIRCKSIIRNLPSRWLKSFQADPSTIRCELCYPNTSPSSSV